MKYRKKPVVVEAVRFTGEPENIVELSEFMAPKDVIVNYANPEHPQLHISTLEGLMAANVGDYIIKGVQGELYPCKEDIFKATYEEAWTGEDHRADVVEYICGDCEGRVNE